MISSRKKPILVTGSHRSGSSWVGKMLSLSPSVAYIYEPFNIQYTPRLCRAKFTHWFTYICAQNESLYSNELNDCINFRYPLLHAIKSITSLKDAAKLSRDYFRTIKYKVTNKRPLLKDPIALFSAEWLVKEFNMDAVVLIRHPAAFAGSLKSSKWTHPFNHFLEQPLLMEQHLSEYKQEIEKYANDNNNKDHVGQAILLWNLIHHMILHYQKNNKDWIFMKHEDLSENPVREFKTIYNKLGLNFSTDIENTIKSFSSTNNSSGIKRDSKSNIWSWKKRLSTEEIKRIKKHTHKISSQFYTDNDWGEEIH